MDMGYQRAQSPSDTFHVLLPQVVNGVAPAKRKTGSTEMKKPLQPKGLQRFSMTMAEWTGLEPATPGVTGRYSNQLNYHSW